MALCDMEQGSKVCTIRVSLFINYFLHRDSRRPDARKEIFRDNDFTLNVCFHLIDTFINGILPLNRYCSVIFINYFKIMLWKHQSSFPQYIHQARIPRILYLQRKISRWNLKYGRLFFHILIKNSYFFNIWWRTFLSK